LENNWNIDPFNSENCALGSQIPKRFFGFSPTPWNAYVLRIMAVHLRCLLDVALSRQEGCSICTHGRAIITLEVKQKISTRCGKMNVPKKKS